MPLLVWHEGVIRLVCVIQALWACACRATSEISQCSRRNALRQALYSMHKHSPVGCFGRLIYMAFCSCKHSRILQNYAKNQREGRERSMQSSPRPSRNTRP